MWQSTSQSTLWFRYCSACPGDPHECGVAQAISNADVLSRILANGLLPMP